MTVPSLSFLLAAIVAAAIYNILPHGLWRRLFLLVVNLAFLFTFATTIPGLLPYAAFVILGFGLVRFVALTSSGRVYVCAIAAVVLVFCWLKRYEFLPALTFLTFPYVQVGLSYIFFRILHMVIDARSEPLVREASVVSYLNFVLNFTSLVSGPIQRYEDYIETTEVKPERLSLSVLGLATERIIVGLFKVWAAAAVISVLQKVWQAQAIDGADVLSRIVAATGLTALYPVYLFFNFSGYTDFVIGIARLFGIRLPENFDQPFRAASFIEYWSRWHMSLSNWLKTYVYTPLMMVVMRRLKNAALLPYAGAFALFITFFLIGAWHGRTSKFLFFGLLNGFGVAVNQVYRLVMVKRLGAKPFAAFSKQPLYLFAGRGLTFAWVGFTLLWFWSDWPQLSAIVAAIGPGGVVMAGLILIVGACLAMALIQSVSAFLLRFTINGQPFVHSHYVRTIGVTIMVICIIAIQSVMSASAPDIVYKDF